MVTLLTAIKPTLNGGPNVVPGTAPLDPETLTFTPAEAGQWAPISSTKLTLIFVKNADNNVSHSLTLKHYKTGDTDEVIAVTGATAGAIKVAGPILPYRLANKTVATAALGKGSNELTWSSTTGMNIAVVHVPMASK